MNQSVGAQQGIAQAQMPAPRQQKLIKNCWKSMERSDENYENCKNLQ